MAISKAMQIYCGDNKNEAFLKEGLDLLKSYEEEAVPEISCENPHELMRALEVFDILEVSKLIVESCLLRKSSSRALCFERTDYPEMDPEEDRCFITIRQEEGKVVEDRKPLNYYGDLKENYEKWNQGYMKGDRK